jgi:Uma2 family endonuclease
MPVSQQTYLRVVLEDPEGKWELHCGKLRQKPDMTTERQRTGWILGFRLQQQLSLGEYEVRVNSTRAQRTERRYYVPDVMVIPAAYVRRLLARPGTVEAYADPLPLVVEIWSPSTGAYDVMEKLPEYRRRGDAEIWLLHPYERTLTVWRRQPGGAYTETVYRGGSVRPASLPNVTIDLDALFTA